jgi:hypothetical protein
VPISFMIGLRYSYFLISAALLLLSSPGKINWILVEKRALGSVWMELSTIPPLTAPASCLVGAGGLSFFRLLSSPPAFRSLPRGGPVLVSSFLILRLPC